MTVLGFFSLFLFALRVSSLIYPTKPIGETVYEAGHLVSVEWIDDDKAPILEDLEIARIDLYLGDDTFIATLASDVDPMTKQRDLIIPSNAEDNDKYTLRFFYDECDGTQSIIYTAYFAITSSITKPDLLGLVTMNDSESGNWYQPLLTVVLPNTTYVSTLSPTQKPSPSTTSPARSTHHAGAVPSFATSLRFNSFFSLCYTVLGVTIIMW